MTRISVERKAEAIKSISEVGVPKTHDALGISIQTLYKWRNEMNTAVPKGKSIARKAKKAAAKASLPSAPDTLSEAEVVSPVGAAIETAKLLLAEDDGHADKIEQLEIENLKLRGQVERLKKALAAMLT